MSQFEGCQDSDRVFFISVLYLPLGFMGHLIRRGSVRCGVITLWISRSFALAELSGSLEGPTVVIFRKICSVRRSSSSHIFRDHILRVGQRKIVGACPLQRKFINLLKFDGGQNPPFLSSSLIFCCMSSQDISLLSWRSQDSFFILCCSHQFTSNSRLNCLLDACLISLLSFFSS